MKILAIFAGIALAASGQSPFPPPGRLVDLGRHRLHVYCTGQGSPTVVVENGLGDFSFDWILVQQKVEKFARICTYDRAGYAWSDPGPKPRTFAQLNLELRDALSKLGERGPFILVGHSFGGGVVRNFASVYPKEVAGMVLVDIVHEDQRIPMGPKARRIRDFATGRPIPKPRETMQASDKLAPAAPKTPGPIDSLYTALPEREQRLHQWAESLPSLEDAESSQKDWSAEYMALLHASPQDGILGNMPLIVLTRGQGYANAELDQERKETQARLARLSKVGIQVIIQSGHNMHLENPDAVANAIRQITGHGKE